MKNIALAQGVLQSLRAAGVHELVLCAGARNAPLVSLLSRDNPFTTYSFFEERSAGFFALGRILATRQPVAVITTSGTAAAELLPATIEADYQGLPLILVTADRPKSYRGSGSPQTIIQPGIYSHYVESCLDIEGEWSGFALSGRRPVHLNICFDEPLLDGESAAWDKAPPPISTFKNSNASPIEIKIRRPLVILSGLNRDQSLLLLPLLLKWKRPVLCEATSQLRGHPGLKDLEIHSGDRALKQIKFDGVIRIGGIPTARFWRDLERSDLPVLNFTDLPFSGLARTRDVHPFEQVFSLSAEFEPITCEELSCDRERSAFLLDLIRRFPLSEPAWVRWTSLQMARNSRLYLGNSLPIREWDLAARSDTDLEVFASRGVNGIDGQISTFLGVCDLERENWCLVGDLTALYDLSAPWILRERPLPQACIVIMNNGGGKIFERLFRNRLFENSHDIRFAEWARMWALNYQRLERPEPLAFERGVSVVEILPDVDQTQAFWREWDR